MLQGEDVLGYCHYTPYDLSLYRLQGEGLASALTCTDMLPTLAQAARRGDAGDQDRWFRFRDTGELLYYCSTVQ